MPADQSLTEKPRGRENPPPREELLRDRRDQPFFVFAASSAASAAASCSVRSSTFSSGVRRRGLFGRRGLAPSSNSRRLSTPKTLCAPATSRLLVNRSRFAVNGPGSPRTETRSPRTGPVHGERVPVRGEAGGGHGECGPVHHDRPAVTETGGRFTMTQPSVMKTGARFTMTLFWWFGGREEVGGWGREQDNQLTAGRI
jgi:hypothetical protein